MYLFMCVNVHVIQDILHRVQYNLYTSLIIRKNVLKQKTVGLPWIVNLSTTPRVTPFIFLL